MDVLMNDQYLSEKIRGKLERCDQEPELVVMDLSPGLQTLRDRIENGERVILVLESADKDVMETFKAMGVFEVYLLEEVRKLIEH